MARFLIFDSQNKYTTKSDGSEIGAQFRMADSIAVAVARRSNPVRCFNAQEEQRIVGIEWMLEQISEGQIYAFRWWPEYFSDVPSLAQPPTVRVWKDVNRDIPWGRAMVANDAGGGLIDLNPLVYQMNMTNRAVGSIASDCLYIPVSVHGLWMRVAIYCSLADSTGVTQDQLDNMRLRAFAHVGGHTEAEYTEENGDKIYAYNAYKA